MTQEIEQEIGQRQNENGNNITIPIFRYKFTQEYMDELYQFSKIHQYDDRVSFKEAWEIWINENEDSVNNEMTRIRGLGYNGDIIDKMFKSARYYFRKKNTAIKELGERQQYVGVQKEVLDAMDRHIIQNINSENYKPSNGFSDFCNSNIDVLKKEIAHLIENKMTDSKSIQSKFKKTYKNRYFMISTQNK